MLTVYGRANSSNVQAVMWGVAELGLTARRLDYGHRFGGLDTEAFGALNPHRKVPVLDDNGTIIWESCAILRYLVASYGSAPFWPEERRDRARVDMWAEWAKHSLAVAFTVPIFWSRVRTAAADRDEAALAVAIRDYDRSLATLAEQIGDAGFILGDALTLADIIAGHALYRWFDIDIPRAPNPRIEAYYQRLTERSAYRDAVMVPYDELRVEGA